MNETPLTQKVGMLLGRLGFERAAGHGKARSWQVTLNQVEQSAKLAGIKLEAVSQQEESTEILNYFDQRSIVNNSEELPF